MGLLKPGELASGIKARSDARRTSTERRIAAIEAALQDPDKATPDLLEACKTQANLAAWHNDDLGIAPLSLNTLKKNLDELYDSGFKGFLAVCDRLLKKVVEHKARPGTREWYQLEAQRLKAENEALMQGQMAITAQYLDLLKEFRNLSEAHVFLQDRLKQHLQKFPGQRQGLQVIEGGKDASSQP